MSPKKKAKEEASVKNSSLALTISSHHSDFHFIPKLVELRDDNYNMIDTQWLDGYNYKSPKIDSGVYIVSVSLSSGDQKEKVVQLSPNEDKPLTFDFSGISPRESQEWAYLSKKIDSPLKKGTSSEFITGYNTINNVRGRIWKFTNSFWSSTEVQMPAILTEPGENFTFKIERALHVLQVEGQNAAPLCVCIPPSENLRCLIKPAEGPLDAVYPLDVTVSTDNWKAESLLTLLTSGKIVRAKSLMNVDQAEQLLYDKMRDPALAAIGGYYLLKVHALERLHDWANNLANWFEWMPDGAIIHGWQMLRNADNRERVVGEKVRERFLQAVDRGIPIYSEGLRLLYDGLKLLTYNSTEGDAVDIAVKGAFEKIKKYVQVIDWTQETTTFIGRSPDLPGIDRRDS